MTRQQAARRRRQRHRRQLIGTAAIIAVALIITAVACSTQDHGTKAQSAAITAPAPLASVKKSAPNITATAPETVPEPTPEPTQTPWTDEDVAVIAQTLSGECYEDKPADKRLVAEVIVNRVSDGGFGKSVVAVVTAPYQFSGYWNPSREISENDIEIATETLRDWYAGGCKALSEWLYFTAGENRENNFRTTY